MGESPKDDEKEPDSHLTGTTYKVYRYMLRHGRPVGISEVQKAIGLSSSSVAEYHIKKLLRFGLIKEESGGYVINKVVMENVIRIGRTSIPTHTSYAVFFGVTLLLLVVFLRPPSIDSVYFLALVVNVVALSISLYEVKKTLKRLE